MELASLPVAETILYLFITHYTDTWLCNSGQFGQDSPVPFFPNGCTIWLYIQVILFTKLKIFSSYISVTFSVSKCATFYSSEILYHTLNTFYSIKILIIYNPACHCFQIVSYNNTDF